MKQFVQKLLLAVFFGCIGLMHTAEAQTTVTIGANSGANGTIAYPSPLQDYYKTQRAQYLYTAAELSAAGITAGSSISQIGWVVNATTISSHNNDQ